MEMPIKSIRFITFPNSRYLKIKKISRKLDATRPRLEFSKNKEVVRKKEINKNKNSAGIAPKTKGSIK